MLSPSQITNIAFIASSASAVDVFCYNTNMRNNVYGAVLMSQSLQVFTRFI